MPRECGNCTKCCDGWLSANILEYKMFKGNPCFYVDKNNCNCSIYAKRPLICSDFKCAWLQEESVIPAWMKPNLINQIIIKHITHEFVYYELVEAGEKIDSSILNWFVQMAVQKKMNVKYSLYNVPYYIGDEYFCKSRPMVGIVDNK